MIVSEHELIHQKVIILICLKVVVLYMDPNYENIAKRDISSWWPFMQMI